MAQQEIGLRKLEAAMLQSLEVDPSGGIIYEVALKVVFNRPFPPAQESESHPTSPSSEQLRRQAESSITRPLQAESSTPAPPEAESFTPTPPDAVTAAVITPEAIPTAPPKQAAPKARTRKSATTYPTANTRFRSRG